MAQTGELPVWEWRRITLRKPTAQWGEPLFGRNQREKNMKRRLLGFALVASI
ncbi:MAG: hypothetical protein RLZ37_1829, partial [Actinomycetota bacterium]